MAITVSQHVAYAEDLAEPITTASFDTVSGNVYVIILHQDETGDTTGGLTGVTITDNQGGSGPTYNLIAQRGAELNGANAGYVGAWWFAPATITGLTVTLDAVGDTGSGDCMVCVLVVSGNVSTSDPIGASTTGLATADPFTTASITPETSGVGIIAWSDWNAATHTATSNEGAGLTVTSAALTSGNLDMGRAQKALSAGVGATASINAAGTPDGNYIWFEIRDEGGAAATPVRLSTRMTLGVGR